MKKKITALLLGLMMVFGVSTNVYAHYDRAYWHEEKETTPYIEQYVDWMITIPDDRRLSDLSLPGTHDTMAYNGNIAFGNIARTQTMNLEQQLNSGIRYLDIRLAHRGNYFQLHHGAVDLGYNFDDVLQTVISFLESHPTETVLMRIKQEHTGENDRRMLELFTKYYEKYKESFWDREKSENPYNPRLSEFRGKILILSDVYSIYQGINYREVIKQDEYHLGSNWDLYRKWESVKSQIEKSDKEYPDRIMMNYLSGSGGAYPYFVASGYINPDTYASRLSTGLTEPGFKNYYPDFPRTGRFGVFATISFEGTNTLTADYLRSQGIKRAGIVAADFPGERLIDEIIQCNYRK
ncbi:phosphatidylinositol-specific phospholipase C [Streptococcus suis]|nr:phosphatidylinositol-specific phospholipase C [Streptococcus suis]